MSKTITDNISSLTTSYNEFQENVTKFLEKDTAAAGARSRKSLLEISKIVRELRKQVQERRKELKVKAA